MSTCAIGTLVSLFAVLASAQESIYFASLNGRITDPSGAITTGSNTLQGTAARPLVNGAFTSRNAGVGAKFVSLSTRLSRTFPLGERVRLEALAEAFNVLNHRNDLTRNGVFGSGAYAFNPSATFGQITAVNDPRVLQFAVKIKY